MKETMVTTLSELMEKDPNLYILTGDLGYPFFLKFAEQYKTRFFNMGIAEQNMVSTAAGLAIAGRTVFIYSIATFATMRCLEQIRHDLCYHCLNVNILGYGSGFTYAAYGVTHYGLEDLALMRALPKMQVYSPATAQEVKQVIKEAYRYQGPAYIRLGKLSTIDQSAKLLQSDKQPANSDLAIFVTGSITAQVLEAQQLLANRGVSAKVFSVPVIKPLNEKKIIRQIGTSRYVFVVEEHLKIGGLGSAIAEIVAGFGRSGIRYKVIALPDEYPKIIGSQEYLWAYHGLSAEKIAKTISQFIAIEPVNNLFNSA